MKLIKRARRSLIFSCAVYFALFTLIIVLLYTAFQWMSNQMLSESVFTMYDLMSYEEELRQEDYTQIPAHNSKNSAIIIFDETGRIQYASNDTISDIVFFADLDLIGDYHSGEFFDVFEHTTPEGDVQYYVYLNTYATEGIVPKSLDYCLLDEEYRIIEGTLFANRQDLTQREFELLCGISRTNSILEKYVYKNEAGQTRILAFLYTNVSNKQYNEILQSANAIWLIGVPSVFLAILLFTFLFFNKIKKRIMPLNRTIVSYEKGNASQIDPGAVPSEFYETVCNFKALLSELERTREEKDRLYAERQRLIADISHDLKTPLTVIQGYSKALLEHRVPPEKQPQYLEAMFQKSQLATDLVNDLFLFTQMEHPDYQLQLEQTDFGEFVKALLAEKYMELSDAGFLLSVDIPDQPLPLPIDRRLMRRLLENLLSNAVKYNTPGTTIYVVIHDTAAGAWMCVADDGVGIPPEITATLFQPFVTGNRARTTGKGTGLGLSIAQRVAQMHRGTLELVQPPQLPYHTQFVLRLPGKAAASQLPAKSET